MRIVWINEYARVIGGCESYIANTVKLLKSHGVHSTLLYNPLQGADGNFLKIFDAAFPLVDLPNQLNDIPHDLVFVHQWYRNDIFHLLGGWKEPVIRFCHDCWLFCLRRHKMTLFRKKACQRIAGCRCYPLLCTVVRGDNFLGVSINTLPQLRYAQSLNQKLDGFVVASHFIEDQALGNGFDPDKVRRIPLYALEPTIAKDIPLHESDLIFYAGQLIYGKGLDIAIKALAKTSYPYRLVVAGEGKQKPDYLALVRKLGLENRVQFLGRIDQFKLEEWYARAGCVVFPTRIPEPYGLVGLEAMRFGTPVIASMLGGITDWMEEGKTGYVVPPDDPEALAKILDDLWEHPEKRERIAKEAPLIYRQKYTPERHIEVLLANFRQWIDEKKRFTLRGPPEVETEIAAILEEVTTAVKKKLDPSSYSALLLIGGYGKGEGGFIEKEGRVRPHNNLDFLLLTKSQAVSKKELDQILLPISNKHGIGFDVSVIPESKLKHSPNLLIWHEMYHGHKLLLGEKSQISKLPFADLKTVPPSEFWALMINRGSLLLINEQLLELPDQERLRPILIKHVMKAIIGFGDALLYFLGDYHWSYRRKWERIRSHPSIAPQFRSLYDEAANFRFEPAYQHYSDRDVKKWMNEMRSLFASLYLQCEAKRLNVPALTWSQYWNKALETSLSDTFQSGRTALQKFKAYLHPPRTLLGKTVSERLGFRLLTRQQRLAILFPLIAFQLNEPEMREQARLYLEAKSDRWEDLRIAYLKQWSIDGDINFSRSMKEWGVSLP